MLMCSILGSSFSHFPAYWTSMNECRMYGDEERGSARLFRVRHYLFRTSRANVKEMGNKNGRVYPNTRRGGEGMRAFNAQRSIYKQHR